MKFRKKLGHFLVLCPRANVGKDIKGIILLPFCPISLFLSLSCSTSNWVVENFLKFLQILCCYWVTQMYLTLCNSMDCSLPGSSVHRILQARILEWVVISSSRESSRPRDQIWVSFVSCIGRWLLYHWCHLERPILFHWSVYLFTSAELFDYL